jgi:hypothetical protein
MRAAGPFRPPLPLRPVHEPGSHINAEAVPTFEAAGKIDQIPEILWKIGLDRRNSDDQSL